MKKYVLIALGGTASLSIIAGFFFMQSRQDIPKETQKIESAIEWKNYKNTSAGFSFDYPSITYGYGCKYHNDEKSFRPAGEPSVPVTIVEDITNERIILTVSEAHALTGTRIVHDPKEPKGYGDTYFFSKCEKVSLDPNKLLSGYYERDATVEAPIFASWQFKYQTIMNEKEIDSWIASKYGNQCVGKKEDVGETGTYTIIPVQNPKVKQGSGGLDDPSSCFINWDTEILYNPKKHLLVSWDPGQAQTFYSNPDAVVDFETDKRIIESFKFLE